MSDDGYECGIGEELMLGPALPSGGRVALRHRSDHSVVPCVAHPCKDGKSCMGSELVALTQIEGDRYEVETIYSTEDRDHPSDSRSKGPAKVSTKSYREGWDRTFN